MQVSMELEDGSDKIPYDTKELTITLSTPIASGAISPSTVTLTPHIDGQVSVSPDARTISYHLANTLEIGESYELRVA